ncbi:MAG: OmpA family protein [Bryobacteraceae bacterium]|nr:OmpA family protein [Bryobacteraceae bacterium]
MKITTALLFVAAVAAAQETPQPIYRVTVVDRTTHAVNYRHRAGETSLDFKGTALMPEARGTARVETKKGYTDIEVRFDKVGKPTQYGPEYLTYVLWAITPEGRPANLGELVIGNGDDARLHVTTELQAFGMIVTAEPYFAVTQPSDVVVMENIVRRDTEGTIQFVEAKYELLPRGVYRYNPTLWERQQVLLDPKIPNAVYQARNALAIAQSAGADKYAADTLEKARREMQNAEAFATRDERRAIQIARQVTQTAEDARLITLKRREEEDLALERARAQEREAQAKATADEEARRRAEADRQRLAAQEEAERAARQKADAEAAQRAAAAQAAQAQAQAAQAQAEAERARLAAEEAKKLRDQAQQERLALRQKLQQQLNSVLETRESARGLIVSMPDVLFDFGKYTLKPEAREKLAKISGIVLANPGLKLEVEGHTDSIGSEQFNQELSEKRAAAVRDYFVAQGLKADDIVTRGFGKTQPVASNDTSQGRQQNRRVEMVVSGAQINPRGEVGQ